MAESSERPGLFKRLLGGGQAEKVRTARYPLQAYGKLPIYKDFISVGLTDPAAREFRQWIDRGYSYRWAENEAYRDTPIPPHGFLLRLPESKSCVAGVLWGSSDEGGLRKFPFAVFLSFPLGQPASDPFAALHYLTAFERQCAEIREGYAAGASLAAFYKAYRGAEFECALPTREQTGRELKSALAALTVSELAEALYGDQSLAGWQALETGLADAARAGTAAAVRLPLSGALPRSREIGLWLRWIERLPEGGRRAPTGLLYSGGRGPGRAVLLFRDLSADDFLLLHPGLRGQAGVLDVGTVEVPPEPPTPPAALAEPVPAAAAAPAAPAPPPPPEAAAPAGPEAAALAEQTAAAQAAAAPQAEPAPFPEAEAGETAVTGLRETFSALVVPAFAAAGANAGQPGQAPEPMPAGAPPPPPESAAPAPEAVPVSEAIPDAPAPPAQPAENPAPAHWKTRLNVLVGL